VTAQTNRKQPWIHKKRASKEDPIGKGKGEECRKERGGGRERIPKDDIVHKPSVGAEGGEGGEKELKRYREQHSGKERQH